MNDKRIPDNEAHALLTYLCLQSDDLHGRPVRPSAMLCGMAGTPAVLAGAGAGAGGYLALEGGYEAVLAGQLLLQQLQAGRLSLQGSQGIHLGRSGCELQTGGSCMTTLKCSPST